MEKKFDPRLAWEMFHKIYHMYSDINNKEETSTALLLTRMSDQKDINKVSETTVNSHDNHQNEFIFLVIMIVPPNLHQIQLKCGTMMKLGWTPMVNGTRFFYLQVL